MSWITLSGARWVTLSGDPLVPLGGSGPTPLPTPSTPYVEQHYGVDLCVGWVKVAEVTAGTFDGVLRHLALGEWSLTGYVDDLVFQAGYELADVDTIRVVANDRIVFGGLVAPVATGVGGLDEQRNAAGSTYTLKGGDLWAIPAGRLAYPTPSSGPPWPDAHDDRSGVASTVAAGYLRDNAGSGALAARQIPGLAIVDGAVGTSGVWSARLQPLDQLIARICREGSITCRTALGFDGSVTFTFTSAADYSANIVLSDQGDLTAIHKVTTPPVATYVIAGGQGELTARTFADAGSATGLARREVFADQSSLATSAEVAQSASTTLAVDATQTTVAAQVTDLAAEALTFGLQYDVGDVISAEIDGARYTLPIESVTFHIGVDRAVIRPVLGTGTLNLVTGLLRDVANLQSRLATNIA